MLDDAFKLTIDKLFPNQKEHNRTSMMGRTAKNNLNKTGGLKKLVKGITVMYHIFCVIRFFQR